MHRRVAFRPASTFSVRAARRLPLFAASALLLASPAALAALSVDIVRVGLFGDAFPSSEPDNSATTFSGSGGRIAGSSSRPTFTIGAQTYLEVAAWYYKGSTTTRVGLFEGPEHSLSPDASGQVQIYSHLSTIAGFGPGDLVYGTSMRFSSELWAGERPRGYSRLYERGFSAWIYSGGVTTQVGLTDAEHTAFDGARFSTLTALNAAGQAIGTSARFAAGLPINTNSTSTWFFNGTATIRTGLTAGDHTADDNYHRSENVALNGRGDVVGHTNRYGSGAAMDLGRSAWLHREGATLDLSLTGSGFEKTVLDGATERTYRHSTVVALNGAGHVIGTSARFGAGGADAGQSVWWFGTSTLEATIDISPVGADFVRGDGYRFAAPSWLEGNGAVVGTAARFLGSADGGRSAWLYSPDTGATRDLSPTGPGFVRGDGYRFATPLARTELGHIVGGATRYAGSAENGQAVWLFDGEATRTDIGLHTPEVTGAGGARTESFVAATANGKILGYSARNDGGREAWLHTPAASAQNSTTQAIGLSGPGRTQTILAHTQTSHVIGHADRPDGGREVWRYDGSVTADIGMAGGTFETATGLRHSNAQLLNASGDVVGFSRSYDETGAENGGAFWFNDGASTRLVTPLFSNVGINEYRYRVSALTDSGLVVGHRDYIYITEPPFYSNVFVWDSRAAPGEEMTAITIGMRSRPNQVWTDVRFVSDKHGMVIGEYRNYAVNNQLRGFYVWVRGLGTFDLDSLVGTQLFAQTGISSLAYLDGEFRGFYSFTETPDGVAMTFEQDTRTSVPLIYQLNINPAAIPEPASFGVFAGLGALGLAALRRRRRA